MPDGYIIFIDFTDGYVSERDLESSKAHPQTTLDLTPFEPL